MVVTSHSGEYIAGTILKAIEIAVALINDTNQDATWLLKATVGLGFLGIPFQRVVVAAVKAIIATARLGQKTE